MDRKLAWLVRAKSETRDQLSILSNIVMNHPLILFSVFISPAVCETALRSIGYTRSGSLFASDPSLGWSLTPGLYFVSPFRFREQPIVRNAIQRTWPRSGRERDVSIGLRNRGRQGA